MEQDEEFIAIKARITAYEKQLTECEENFLMMEQSAITAQREIEEYFHKCVNALAVKKASLLSECAISVRNFRKTLEETQQRLQEIIEGCKKALEAGSFVFNTNTKTAETIWKSTKTMGRVGIEKATIETKLPKTLLDDIENHITVSIRDWDNFSRASFVTTHVGSKIGYEARIGENAKFNQPAGICWSPIDKCLYVCDFGNYSIRKVTRQGEVTTHASCSFPYAIALNHKNNRLFFVDTNTNTINKVTSSGVRIFVGYSERTRLKGPYGIAIDQTTGNIYVSENDGYQIQVVTPKGELRTLAGYGTPGDQDGNGTVAKFKPSGICFDEKSKSLLVCDRDSNKLKRVSVTGDVSTICTIQRPSSVAITSKGTILVTSYLMRVVYIVTKQENGEYEAKILAGSGKEGTVDGNPEDCAFHGPNGIAIDEELGCCFVTESKGHTIRKISFL